MQRKALFSALLCILVITLCLSPAAAVENPQKKNFTPWKALFPDADWNKFPPKDLRIFRGVLRYEKEPPGFSFVMRYNPYKLGKHDVYCGGSDDLKPWVGKEVEIEGALKTMEVEGQLFVEIWPVRVRAVK